MNDQQISFAFVTEHTLANVFHKLLTLTDGETMREGTKDTPERAARAWREKTAGYRMDPMSIAKMFEHNTDVKGMVLARDVEVESMCEHHFERIWGYAHIGYIPKGKILGLSKFQRLVDAFARRLQTQEHLTAQLADCLLEQLTPHGVGVVIEARHACIEARGVNKRGQVTVTSEMRGDFYTDPATRAEFINLARTQRVF